MEAAVVRKDGSRARTRNYPIGMLPQTALCSYEEHYVTAGCEQIPLAGASELEPGDLLGTTAAQLLQVPLTAVAHDS